ncbi:MAG: Rieske 2Fe-2S domain-containing protein [Geodermatophilaceae bacterium]
MSISTALDRIADTGRLDAFIAPLRNLVNRLLRPQAVKDVLHGVWLGHPVHPPLAQVPIGAWMSAGLLDVLPGHRKEAQLLIATGIAAAVPTAMAGAADWSESDVGQQRVGIVHALMNTTALALYVGSLSARTRGNHGRGRLLAYAGLGVATVSAGIGGHLAYHQAAGASHASTAARAVSQDWIDLGLLDDLPEGQPVLRVSTDSDDRPAPLCVLRRGDQAQVLVDVCSHLGGPLHSGELIEVAGKDCLVCPWHGSTFAVADGHVVRGPAVASATVLSTRVSEGRLQARLPERHLN